MRQALLLIILSVSVFGVFWLDNAPEPTVNEQVTVEPEVVQPGRREVRSGFIDTSLEDDYIDPDVLVELTNKERTDRGLNALEVHPKLVESAQAKCDDMVERGYFGHYSPDGSKFSIFIDLMFTEVGENLAENYATNKQTVQGFMDSPPHKENMLLPIYNYIGIATCSTGDGIFQNYTVHHFAK